MRSRFIYRILHELTSHYTPSRQSSDTKIISPIWSKSERNSTTTLRCGFQSTSYSTVSKILPNQTTDRLRGCRSIRRMRRSWSCSSVIHMGKGRSKETMWSSSPTIPPDRAPPTFRRLAVGHKDHAVVPIQVFDTHPEKFSLVPHPCVAHQDDDVAEKFTSPGFASCKPRAPLISLLPVTTERMTAAVAESALSRNPRRRHR